MKSKLKFLGAIALLGIAGFFACKKSSSSSSIVGTWKISKQIIDSNCSGTPNLTISSDTSWANDKITFNANGTIVENYYNYVNQGSYSLIDGNKYLKLVDTSYGGSTSYLQVVSITSSTMQLKDTMVAACGDALITYTRQ